MRVAMTAALTILTLRSRALGCRGVSVLQEGTRMCPTPSRPATCCSTRGSGPTRTTCWVPTPPDTMQRSWSWSQCSLTYTCLCVGDCKPSEVKAFAADYLEKVVEPCDWLALWSTDVFDVLVEVSPSFRNVSVNIMK